MGDSPQSHIEYGFITLDNSHIPHRSPMPSITKHKDGYRVQVQVGKNRASKVFPTKARAQTWAQETAIELRKKVAGGVDDRLLFGDVLLKYAAEVSTKKKGVKWESVRLKAMARHDLFRDVQIKDVTPGLIGKYRDARLKEVIGATVRRDMSLLSSVFQKCVIEWRYAISNPVRAIEKPQDSPHREVIVSDADVEAMLTVMKVVPGEKVTTRTQYVAAAFLFALQTGMRLGEICALTWADIDGQVAQLKMTKNGKPRKVPLAKTALAILATLDKKTATVFKYGSAQMDPTFRRYRDEAQLSFTFHDTRHTFTTRVAQAGKIDPLNLAKILGHSDLKMTMRYFHPKESALADLLDQ